MYLRRYRVTAEVIEFPDKNKRVRRQVEKYGKMFRLVDRKHYETHVVEQGVAFLGMDPSTLEHID